MEPQKTLNSQSNLEKENQGRRHHNSRHQVRLQSCSDQNSTILAQRQTDSQIKSRIENPEMNPQLQGQLIFHKAGKNIQWEKDSLFNKWCWENWIATCKRMKLDHFLPPCTKINSKQIKDLNVRHETIQILDKNTGSNLFDMDCSNFFLDMSPEARETK